MKKFTVLMSLYSKEIPSYLDDCLNSLAQQTLRPNEIVIVLDGYIPDDLMRIVHKWEPCLPIKTISLDTNIGLGNALNIGLQHATYELIARMDTDDICIPERFEKQVKYFDEHKDTIILGGAIAEYEHDFSVMLGRRFSCNSASDIINYSLSRNPFNHMTVMFVKSFIIDVGGYKHHLYMEDYNLWLRCIANGALCHNLDTILVHARTGKNMIKRRKGLDYIKSEVELLKLKNIVFPNNKLKIISISLLRILTRLLPANLLSIVYKRLRNQPTR